MTTDQSLHILFEEPAWYINPGINKSTARVYKKRFREGRLSFEKKKEILESCGYRILVEMQWEKKINKQQGLKLYLISKLRKENAFWSYDMAYNQAISDNKLIELVMLHLDIDDIKLLFRLFPKKKIQIVWKEKILSLEPLYHGMNRLYALLFFGVMHPDRYIRDWKNQRLKSIQWKD